MGAQSCGHLIARTRGGPIAAPGRGTLLMRCLDAGVPVGSACSGRGACARCRVRVLAGGAALSPVSDREARVLARNHAGDDERLACLCRIADPTATVEITTGYW